MLYRHDKQPDDTHHTPQDEKELVLLTSKVESRVSTSDRSTRTTPTHTHEQHTSKIDVRVCVSVLLGINPLSQFKEAFFLASEECAALCGPTLAHNAQPLSNDVFCCSAALSCLLINKQVFPSEMLLFQLACVCV